MNIRTVNAADGPPADVAPLIGLAVRRAWADVCLLVVRFEQDRHLVAWCMPRDPATGLPRIAMRAGQGTPEGMTWEGLEANTAQTPYTGMAPQTRSQLSVHACAHTGRPGLETPVELHINRAAAGVR